MCGIAGLIDPAIPSNHRHTVVERMCMTMVHRGPDDFGIESLGPATIGMRRLAIFDPAHGHQPMATRDGRFHLVFNGAIYNFRALRDELSAAGFEFRTDCDTEVLLAAFARWGERCLPRLRGMFAFAVWDAREQSLFLARDPFGIKPLYYQHEGARLLFASELNGLVASGPAAVEIDPLAVADYLAWFSVPAPRTIYRGLLTLRPGEYATFRRGVLQVHAAWQFHTIAPPPRICTSRAEFVAELRARLDDTIRAHLVADVPVGAFLSGGLDSAVIAGLMARASSRRLKTFSLGFAEADYDESADAEETARHIGTEHHTRTLTGAEVAAALSAVLAAFDQPTGDGLNTYFVSQAARAGGVTVALSGLGGDELFGGYPSFRNLPSLERWRPLWRAMPSFVQQPMLARLRRGGVRYRKLADLLQHSRSLNESCALQRRVFSETRRRQLLSPEARRHLEGRPPYHPQLDTLAADLAGAGALEAISAWELRTYMADVLLRDSDVMSMQHSLELRVPFVDRPLIEWLWHQPERFKFDRAHPKSALAEAVGDLLPPKLFKRRKRGFFLPFAVWMRRELRPLLEETFAGASVARSGFFSTDAVQRTWRDYLAGSDQREWSRVWSLAVLIDFVNRRRVAPAAGVVPAPVAVVSRPRLEPATGARPSHRTLLLAPEIFASDGGIPRILRSYLKALCELAGPNDSVHLGALNDASIDPQQVRGSAGDRLTQVRVCNRKKNRFVRDAFALGRNADRIICGHIGQLPVALAIKLVNPRVRYYLIAHGIEVWRPFTALERLSLRRAERILCVSDYTRREVLRHCHLPTGRAVVLPNALDPFFHIARGVPLAECPPVILVVTRLTRADRYKGVENMIKAMPSIRERLPAARLRIIGRGDDLPYLRQVCDQLRLRDSVDFLGYVDDRQMAEELRSCRLFALPSKKEGFGLVYLEAMANGRPCVGARAGGAPEIITPEAGMLVEYGDIPGLATSCLTALTRSWDEQAILDRARAFSYSSFRERLASLLPPLSPRDRP